MSHDPTGSDAATGAAAPKTIQQAKRAVSRRFLWNPGVSGVGIEATATGEEQIKVYLTVDDPVLVTALPASVDGYAVVVEIIGRITPRADPGP